MKLDTIVGECPDCHSPVTLGELLVQRIAAGIGDAMATCWEQDRDATLSALDMAMAAVEALADGGFQVEPPPKGTALAAMVEAGHA